MRAILLLRTSHDYKVNEQDVFSIEIYGNYDAIKILISVYRFLFLFTTPGMVLANIMV